MLSLLLLFRGQLPFRQDYICHGSHPSMYLLATFGRNIFEVGASVVHWIGKGARLLAVANRQAGVSLNESVPLILRLGQWDQTVVELCAVVSSADMGIDLTANVFGQAFGLRLLVANHGNAVCIDKIRDSAHALHLWTRKVVDELVLWGDLPRRGVDLLGVEGLGLERSLQGRGRLFQQSLNSRAAAVFASGGGIEKIKGSISGVESKGYAKARRP